MDYSRLGFKLLLSKFNVSAVDVAFADGSTGKMLRLHFRVERRIDGQEPVMQDLPPIFLSERDAAALPAAMLNGIKLHLPEIAAQAAAQTLAAAQPAAEGGPPERRH